MSKVKTVQQKIKSNKKSPIKIKSIKIDLANKGKQKLHLPVRKKRKHTMF